ncbi:uncharacterized protein KRP23_4232 [Phytophthora ramorum]|uniref:uncharacterized protein n=1 Tax=Phytophthora ramorum TaxID=164328 RepID=UPI0030A44CCF|nr:hypothetical protein KRP23_4232 [Phytophthora ramorum]
MNPEEFDELRRKLRMQTASRRYRKRKKEEARKQKMQMQELQAELVSLQELEAYRQRSVESMEEELKIHKAEVADLSGKIQDAAKEELHWMTIMRSLRK